MIRHILFIKFNPGVKDSEIDPVRQSFHEIKNKIDGILNVEWGENDSPEQKNAGYTHCVLMTFADEAARRRYLPHPSHEELKRIFKPLLRDIIVLDFTLAR